MNNNFKNYLKIFLVFYALGLLVFNWSDVSWIFNYKAVGGLAYDFFNPYSQNDVLADYSQNQTLPTPTIADVIVKTDIKNNGPVVLKNVKVENSDKQNILEIPAIFLETEIVFPQTKDVNVLHGWLDKGVIYYQDSVPPTQSGQITILGHSAPPGWPKIKHDTVFSNLEKLNIGDEIYLNLEYKKYTYKIIDKKIIDRGQEIENPLTGENNVIVLVSCYPPGKDYKRIAVFGEIVQN